MSFITVKLFSCFHNSDFKNICYKIEHLKTILQCIYIYIYIYIYICTNTQAHQKLFFIQLRNISDPNLHFLKFVRQSKIYPYSSVSYGLQWAGIAQPVQRLATIWTVEDLILVGPRFQHPSRPALGSTQTPIQWVTGLSRG